MVPKFIMFGKFENDDSLAHNMIKKRWQPKQPTVNDGRKGIYRVDVDIPAEDWATITDYYDVLIFNTGHW